MPNGGLSLGSILVVDDDPDLREAITTALSDEGYRATGVGSAREALTHLREETTPSLILLDVMMPGMDGWEFRLALKRQPATAQIPVVILSGHRDVRDVALALGAADYLRKPVSMESLLEVAERYCRPIFIN